MEPGFKVSLPHPTTWLFSAPTGQQSHGATVPTGTVVPDHRAWAPWAMSLDNNNGDLRLNPGGFMRPPGFWANSLPQVVFTVFKRRGNLHVHGTVYVLLETKKTVSRSSLQLPSFKIGSYVEVLLERLLSSRQNREDLYWREKVTQQMVGMCVEFPSELWNGHGPVPWGSRIRSLGPANLWLLLLKKQMLGIPALPRAEAFGESSLFGLNVLVEKWEGRSEGVF